MKIPSRITAVDLHACGEPGRVIVLGEQSIPGKTIFEKKTYLETKADGLRKLMLREPRGYPAANCNIVLPPTRPDADVGMIIMEQVEYPPMSGTNTICVVTALLETGILPARVPVTKIALDTPAGLVRVEAQVRKRSAKKGKKGTRKSEADNIKVMSVKFENVPAFAVHLDKNIEVPQIGTVNVDVAYGGMFYVIADARALGLQLTPDCGRDIVRIGEMVKAAAREQLPVAHPENPGISGVTIAVLSGPPTKRSAHAKNAVVVSTGQLDWTQPATWTGAIDRSPCGTGTCAKMAVLHAKGQLALNKDFMHEGILGTTFTGRLIRETKVGPYRAVVPTISGRAWITGYAQYVVDSEDPFPEGFTVGDIWGSS
ncbi:MAG TPA: proline racemase family protein [Candidatus Acidoferrum sp.]|nr:proline racemase family protein [Candidatus Acidoferrum sp.]